MRRPRAHLVIAYLRVSTEEQADSRAGLDAQRAAIEHEASIRGWRAVDWVVDAGWSAKSLKRPGIQAALSRLVAGEADTLVVAKLDRLSRSVHDLSGLLVQAAAEGWSVIALDSPVDTSTPQGLAMTQMLSVMAELERGLIAQRTREALAAKRDQGVRLGRPRTLPAAVVARIGSERQKGTSMRAIAQRLNSDGVPTAYGGPTWYASTVHGVLRSLDIASVQRARAASRTH